MLKCFPFPLKWGLLCNGEELGMKKGLRRPEAPLIPALGFSQVTHNSSGGTAFSFSKTTKWPFSYMPAGVGLITEMCWR